MRNQILSEHTFNFTIVTVWWPHSVVATALVFTYCLCHSFKHAQLSVSRGNGALVTMATI